MSRDSHTGQRDDAYIYRVVRIVRETYEVKLHSPVEKVQDLYIYLGFPHSEIQSESMQRVKP